MNVSRTYIESESQACLKWYKDNKLPVDTPFSQVRGGNYDHTKAGQVEFVGEKHKEKYTPKDKGAEEESECDSDCP